MFPGAIPFALSHAVALTLIGHCHYVIRPPSRLGWWVGEVIAAAVIGLLLRPMWPPLARRLAGGGSAWGPVAVGVFLAAWWHGRVQDTVWIQDPALRPALTALLFASHAGLFGLIFAAIRAAVAATDPAGPRPPKQGLTRSDSVWIGLFGAAAVTFAVWYVGRERTVYCSDFMFYWTQAADWADLFGLDPVEALVRWKVSVQNGGYTLLPAVIPASVMAAFGDHRAVYVGANAGIFLTATAACVLDFVRRVGGPAAGVAPVIAVFLFTLPLAWVPVLLGFPDIGGVALAVVSLRLVGARPRPELRCSELLAAAVILATLPLFRRWYAFWSVGLIVAVALDGAVAAVRHLPDRAAVLRAVRPAVVIGCLTPLFLIALAWPMVRDTMLVDHADSLSGYRSESPLPERLDKIAATLGYGYIALSAACSLVLLAHRETRRVTALLAVTTGVIVVLFFRVQDPERHHQYLFLPALVLPPALAASVALARRPAWLALPLSLGTLTVGGLFLAGTVDVKWWAARHRFAPLAPTVVCYPETRLNLVEFRRLMDFLNRETESGKGFVVLSSSLEFHPSMFIAAERSLRTPFPAARNQMPTSEVDRVTGFPAGLFRAEFVLVADPLQLHLRAEEQRVVAVPYRLVTSGTGIGRAFERTGERFDITGSVAVTVYRRVRPVGRAEFDAFCEDLRRAHPGFPALFDPPASQTAAFGIDGP